ncbi:hypothetical protein CGCF413_v014729 [Colletotrichum fructicola]|nr:hypothetical protein CGCF413_v014729 [Colletotrichum fructicola]
MDIGGGHMYRMSTARANGGRMPAFSLSYPSGMRDKRDGELVAWNILAEFFWDRIEWACTWLGSIIDYVLNGFDNGFEAYHYFSETYFKSSGEALWRQ